MQRPYNTLLWVPLTLDHNAVGCFAVFRPSIALCRSRGVGCDLFLQPVSSRVNGCCAAHFWPLEALQGSLKQIIQSNGACEVIKFCVYALDKSTSDTLRVLLKKLNAETAWWQGASFYLFFNCYLWSDFTVGSSMLWCFLGISYHMLRSLLFIFCFQRNKRVAIFLVSMWAG